MLETIVGILGTAVLGVVTWAFQLNSRVAVMEANHEGLEKLINSRFEEVFRRLDRIEIRLNGKSH